MKRFKLTILSFVGLLVTGACSDFLEEKSQDEVIPSTATDYSEILLAYSNPGGYNMLSVLDDDIEINDLQYNDNENSIVKQHGGVFTWQPDMWEWENGIKDSYESTYTQIMGVNAVLDGVDDVEGSVEEKEVVKAQALGLRAYYYFMLVNLYGEPYNYNKKALGVPLKLTSALLENGITRNTVEEVYTRIVMDLEQASALFGKYSKRRGDFRINGTATDILLSRVYLYMEEWDRAIEAANRAIKRAEGLTDYTTVEAGNQFYMTTYELSEVEWLFDMSITNFPFVPSGDLLSKYTNGDKRETLWFNANGSISKRAQKSGWGPNRTIRISEAYLNRAEALVLSQNANIGEALADLNELRRHRIVGYQDISISDATILLGEIRVERRLELCFDGHRWFDLRRYGMPSISHDYKLKKNDAWVTYVLKEKDPLYTLPIPRAVILNNVKLEQNPSANAPERTGVPKSNL